MNLIKAIVSKIQRKHIEVNIPIIESFEIGDRVKLSEKSLELYKGAYKEMVSKYVFEIVDKEVSIMEGVRLHLHCGTTLMAFEATKVDKNTPLWS